MQKSRRDAATGWRFGSPLSWIICGVLGAAVLAAALVTAISASARSASPWERPGRLVQLRDGRRIDLRCSGEGSPVVVFESGYLGTSAAWAKVQPEVARFTRACSYDRAGLGFSDPGPLPRDGDSIARDLDQALWRAGVKGPFVMVGHSAGGLYVRNFAALRPRDVAGMVLVDPSVPHQEQRFAAEFGAGAGSARPVREKATACLVAASAGRLPSAEPRLAGCTPKPGAGGREALAEAVRPSTWRTAMSEIDTLWTKTSDEVDLGPASYGAMPLVVLTADGEYASLPPDAKAVVVAFWRGLHREVAARSSVGQERLVEGSSHLMMLDRPEVVTGAIREVVDKVRAGAPASSRASASPARSGEAASLLR